MITTDRMLTDDEAQRLRLFDEKATKALASRFYTRAVGAPLKLTITWEQDKPMTAETDGPDDESLDALLLTARLFMQDRDGISFAAIGAIYDRPDVPDELRDKFRRWRDGFNAWLDMPPTVVALVEDGIQPTRGELLSTVVYGDRAHVNPDKRARIERWRSVPAWDAMVHEAITEALAAMCQCARDIRDVNTELLALA